jgi:hypothetical protein
MLGLESRNVAGFVIDLPGPNLLRERLAALASNSTSRSAEIMHMDVRLSALIRQDYEKSRDVPGLQN